MAQGSEAGVIRSNPLQTAVNKKTNPNLDWKIGTEKNPIFIYFFILLIYVTIDSWLQLAQMSNHALLEP